MEKPLQVKTCSQNFLLPISFLQNIFASQYSFLPPNDFLLAKNSPKILLAKFPPQKNLSSKICSPKFPPKKISFKKNCSPFCSPNFQPKEFAPQIFPPKNLLPNIFALHISSHNEILLTKILQNILQAKFPPHKNLSSKTWSQKFPLQKICFKKKLFLILPPPPPPTKFFFFIQKNLLPKYFLPKFAAKHFCSPYYFSQKIASQILLR